MRWTWATLFGTGSVAVTRCASDAAARQLLPLHIWCQFRWVRVVVVVVVTVAMESVQKWGRKHSHEFGALTSCQFGQEMCRIPRWPKLTWVYRFATRHAACGMWHEACSCWQLPLYHLKLLPDRLVWFRHVRCNTTQHNSAFSRLELAWGHSCLPLRYLHKHATCLIVRETGQDFKLPSQGQN